MREGDTGIGSFWRMFDCDLRIAIEPFRALAAGDVKLLLDSLIQICLHLSYYRKLLIAGTVIIFIDTMMQLYTRKRRVFTHFCETARLSLTDLIQELQNALLARITNSAAFRSAQYIIDRSCLLSFVRVLREIAELYTATDDDVPEENDDDEDEPEGAAPEKVTHELTKRYKKTTDQKKWGPTQVILRKWIDEEYEKVLMGDASMAHLTVTNKEKLGMPLLIMKISHLTELICKPGLKKPPRFLIEDYKAACTRYDTWISQHENRHLATAVPSIKGVKHLENWKDVYDKIYNEALKVDETNAKALLDELEKERLERAKKKKAQKAAKAKDTKNKGEGNQKK